MTNLNSCPEDILYIIFFLLHHSDQKTLSLVSKRFYRLKRNSTFLHLLISMLHDYKYTRKTEYYLRNLFGFDNEINKRIDDLRNDIKTFAYYGIMNMGYAHLHRHENIDNFYGGSFFPRIKSVKNFLFFPYGFEYLIEAPAEIKTIIEQEKANEAKKGLSIPKEKEFIYGDEQSLQIIYLLVRISVEIQTLQRKSPWQLNHFNNMMYLIISKMSPEDKIKFLNNIVWTMETSENMKCIMKQPNNWNLCYIWQFPNYNSFYLTNEHEANQYYRAGYKVEKTRFYDHLSRSYTWREETVKIRKSDSSLKYFYPYREMYEEFSNLQEIYRTILFNLFSDVFNSLSKYSNLEFIAATLTKAPYISAISQLKESDMNNVLKENFGFIPIYTKFINIYIYLCKKANKTSVFKENTLRRHEAELNNFSDLITTLNKDCTISTLMRFINDNAPKFIYKSQSYFFPEPNEYFELLLKFYLFYFYQNNHSLQTAFKLFKEILHYEKHHEDRVAHEILQKTQSASLQSTFAYTITY